jgi:hypothetical protein
VRRQDDRQPAPAPAKKPPVVIDLEDDQGQKTLVRLMRFALRVDEQRCLDLAARLRRTHPDATDRELADRLVSYYARRGAVAGFISGLATNPLLALPAAMADVAALLRFYAHLSATVGCLAHEDYFDEPGWEADALVMLAGRRAVSRVLQGVAVEGAKRTAHDLLQRQARAAVVRALGPGAAGRVGAKITQRAITAKLVPIIGGLIGGAWNYLEMRSVGRRIVRFHFGAAPPPPRPAPRQKRLPRSGRATKS